MASLVKPRGFGLRDLHGAGHIIETDDGEQYTSTSMNLKYVLSTFQGFAREHPDNNMVLKMQDDYGRLKSVAKAVSGKVSLLILFY